MRLMSVCAISFLPNLIIFPATPVEAAFSACSNTSFHFHGWAAASCCSPGESIVLIKRIAIKVSLSAVASWKVSLEKFWEDRGG